MWENATFCTSLAAQGILPWLAHWPGEKRRLVIPPALGCPGALAWVNTGNPSVIYHGYPLVNIPNKLWKDPPFSMGKSTISMAMFNSYVSLPEGTKDRLKSVVGI